jgi:hypothetical protein
MHLGCQVRECPWGSLDHPSSLLYKVQCFSTLNHNLAYCYNDARVIKWLWSNAKNRFLGGVGSFED